MRLPNEIDNHRQMSPYVANYRNKLRLFTHEVGMLIISDIVDHVVVFEIQNNRIFCNKYHKNDIKYCFIKIVA